MGEMLDNDLKLILPRGQGHFSIVQFDFGKKCPNCKSLLSLNDYFPFQNFHGPIKCRRCVIETNYRQCENDGGAYKNPGGICKNYQDKSEISTPDRFQSSTPFFDFLKEIYGNIRNKGNISSPRNSPSESQLETANQTVKSDSTKHHKYPHKFYKNPYKCSQTKEDSLRDESPEGKERQFICPQCLKGFKQRGTLNRHLKTHSGKKLFTCDEFGQGFRAPKALKLHNLIHTGEQPFQCKICEKRFTLNKNLKKHFFKFHLEGEMGSKSVHSDSDNESYICDKCSEPFFSYKELQWHLLTHSAERPFQCWICRTSFRRQDTLDQHTQTVHHLNF